MLSVGVWAGDKEKNPRDDPEAIGAREGSAKVSTFIPWKKGNRAGKQLAQEVERQAKVIDDPTIARNM
jgi:hypothetical protein